MTDFNFDDLKQLAEAQRDYRKRKGTERYRFAHTLNTAIAGMDFTAVVAEIERLKEQINSLHDRDDDHMVALRSVVSPLAELCGKPISKDNYPCLTGGMAVEDLTREVVAVAMGEIERLRVFEKQALMQQDYAKRALRRQSHDFKEQDHD